MKKFILAAIFLAVNQAGAATLEQFNGGCSVDNTSALNSYRSYIISNGPEPLILKGCTYRFDSRPLCFDSTQAPHIEGVSSYHTRVLRNYSAGHFEPFICIEGQPGATIRRLRITSGVGSQGDLLVFKATNSAAPSAFVVEDVTFDAIEQADCQRSLLVDGLLKDSDPRGVRSGHVRNILAYCGSSSAIRLNGFVALSIVGGGIYAGGLIVQNWPAISAYLNIILTNINGNVALTACVDCTIKATVVTGQVLTDSNDNYVWIGGRVTGGVPSPSWTNSGVTAN